MPIARGRVRAQLDLGVQSFNGGRARYLAPGSITELDGGEIRITPFESTTHLVMVRVSARVGI